MGYGKNRPHNNLPNGNEIDLRVTGEADRVLATMRELGHTSVGNTAAEVVDTPQTAQVGGIQEPTPVPRELVSAGHQQ